MPRLHRSFLAPLAHALLVAAVAVTCLAGSVTPARSLELIPSIGLTKAADDHSGDSQVIGGLALRQPLAPLLDVEVGVSYHQQSYFGNDLKVRSWPLTASLWLKPISSIYLGAGVGYYPITLDFAEALPIRDSTEDRFGVHVGGGVKVPLSSNLALDFSGRYVFLRSEDSHLVPETFDPDFWSTTVGLAIKF